MKKKTDEIRARLTVHGMGEMTTKEFNLFRRWLTALAKEMAKEKQEIFSKRFRATLYK